MRIRINVDFEMSPRVKRALMLSAPLAIVLAGSIAYAGVPTVFKDGDTLSAQALNDDFAAVDQRLAKLEAFSSKATADGGFSAGAVYCGATGNTVADLSSLAANGSGYGKARAQCQTTCSSPSAHMCSGDELTRTSQLGTTSMPSGWYTSGAASAISGGTNNYECMGWTNGTASYYGSAWGSTDVPSFAPCNTSYPVLCCN